MDKAKLSMYQKANKILEYFWLVVSVACVFFASYFVYVEGYDEAKWYLLFPLLAFAMYIMRRGLRKRFEANLAAQQDQSKKGKKEQH